MFRKESIIFETAYIQLAVIAAYTIVAYVIVTTYKTKLQPHIYIWNSLMPKYQNMNLLYIILFYIQLYAAVNLILYRQAVFSYFCT